MFRVEWPWVSKKMLAAEIRNRQAVEARLRGTVDQHEREIREIIAPMVDRFMHVSIERSHNAARWRCAVDMDTQWVEHVLCHGDSDRELAHLGRYIGTALSKKVVEAIRCTNYRRFG